MPAKRLTVVLSQSRSPNPKKRQLEEDVVVGLFGQGGVDVSVVPHVYDLYPDDPGSLFLKGISGDIVVLSWLYPRAAFWTLARQGIRGRLGLSLLKAAGEEDDVDEAEDEQDADESKPTDTTNGEPIPNRTITCLDLRAYTDPKIYQDEVLRLQEESNIQLVSLGLDDPTDQSPQNGQHQNGNHSNDHVNGRANGEGQAYLDRLTNGENGSTNGPLPLISRPQALAGYGGHDDIASYVPDGPAKRRWYPVIDYTRCTNCMECIDFCLFGVYGLDSQDQILVEQQDNCRKGCPACSRVCPANAIVFPEHKTPAIAGAPAQDGAEGLKIDLSKLFGAPDAIDVAARERDLQLVAAGRQAVGKSVGLPKRQTQSALQPKDDLDDLMDQLDELEL